MAFLTSINSSLRHIPTLPPSSNTLPQDGSSLPELILESRQMGLSKPPPSMMVGGGTTHNQRPKNTSAIRKTIAVKRKGKKNIDVQKNVTIEDKVNTNKKVQSVQPKVKNRKPKPTTPVAF